MPAFAGHDASKTRRPRFVARPARPRLAGEGRHSAGLVEPHPGIELARQHRLAVVAPTLGVGAVDDADEPLKAGIGKHPPRAGRPAFAEVEPEAIDAAVVAQSLVAVG